MKKKISILGVTGSIGRSTLKISDNFIDEIELRALSTHKNINSLLSLIDKYKPEYAVVSDIKEMKKYFNTYETEYNGVKIYSGEQGLLKLCSDKDNDIIINGISGKAGLLPSLKILENGIDLALANKESIVCAGPILKNIAIKNNSTIIPVDSEHSAIFQLLQGKKKECVKQIYLTASGGPFLTLDKKKWNTITIKDALKHPTWKMGNKITIDSATMANKGLEVIEAHYLFDLDYSCINVLTHPQSLIHSMVETIDCEIYAQLGPNDMSIPIQNAIFYPEIKNNLYKSLDFSKAISLDLFPIDMDKFRMLGFAYQCGKLGKLYPVFYNSTNEILVYLFLDSKISFLQIEEFMEKSIEIFSKDNTIDKMELSLDNIKETERLSDIILQSIL
ncbi:MAG: 1-deoxy-D-xylulose-5-phosphate reductoisomerase [Spirochaetes bacterium]|nr:1-deoxy-D-xylulose-5-phosphate reductoisomerase [Spirochaetota bacterium]